MDKCLKSSGIPKQDFIVLIRVIQSISDLVKRGFNLNGTLQFRIGSLIKHLRQGSFVCVVFSILQLTLFKKKVKLFDSYSYHGENLNTLMIKYYSTNI